MLPLSGITVVALEHAVAAPFATRQLADLGARVIKVERPLAGDFARSYDGTVRGMSSHFVWLNRSKESMTLDLKAPQARDVMVRLVDRADVFVQNLAPGAAERLGLSAERLRKDHPRLIVCDISGYGPDGPYCEKKAYDLLIQSEAGLLSITGTEEAPSKAGISIADISAGMYAFTGILTELYRREKTGEGGHVEVSMFEALGEWMGYPLYYFGFGGSPPRRTGARHATIAPYGPFTAGDGGTVMAGLQNEREWAAFCEQVLMRPELACDPRFDTNPRRVANREALEEAIREIFDGMTAGEVASRLDRAQIANSRMNSMEDVWRHPQFTARRRWREVDSPVGALPMLLPPCNHGGFVARMDPIPALGEHTEKVLAELGFLEDAVQRLRADGVV
jgi:crotonobetainyl-CoA:carnitine CoA-transferase CaiB-like acyl-CoA transferase